MFLFFFVFENMLKSATETMEFYLTIIDSFFFLPQRLFSRVKFNMSGSFVLFCVYLNGYYHPSLHFTDAHFFYRNEFRGKVMVNLWSQVLDFVKNNWFRFPLFASECYMYAPPERHKTVV